MSAQFDQITQFLQELDAQLNFTKKPDLYLIGGSAITLAYDRRNRTADLDFIDPPEILVKKGGIDSALAKKYRVYVSPVFEISFSVPEDWKLKCQPILPKLKNIRVLAACVEDIVLGKLARMEPKDLEDILGLKEQNLLSPKKLIARLRENQKELKEISYRNNAKLLFSEVFQRSLVFEKRNPKLKF